MGISTVLTQTGNPWVDENRVCVHLHGGKVPVKFGWRSRDWFTPEDGQVNPYPEAVDQPDRFLYIRISK